MKKFVLLSVLAAAMAVVPSAHAEPSTPDPVPSFIVHSCTVSIIDGTGYFAKCTDGGGVYFTDENMTNVMYNITVGDNVTAIFDADAPDDGLIAVKKVGETK